MPVVAVGLITDSDPVRGDSAGGDADLIGLAGALLWHPRWPWHAAAHFDADIALPDQYLRSALAAAEERQIDRYPNARQRWNMAVEGGQDVRGCGRDALRISLPPPNSPAGQP